MQSSDRQLVSGHGSRHKDRFSIPSRSSKASNVPVTAAAKGPISQLQEFVQSAKLYPMPASCPVLQWVHDTRMVETNLEFKATVSFMLDGVPHHNVGSWMSSKKMAQRDAAERSLRLYVSRWGEECLVRDGHLSLESESDDGTSSDTSVHAFINPVRALADFSSKPPICSRVPPRWSCQCEQHGQYQAFVEIPILGVPHTFPGTLCASEEFAYDDAARRVLWYLQCPGYEDAFEPDRELIKSMAQQIPEPPHSWAKEEAYIEEQQLAERKTVVMRVQNRLQQLYAKKLETGTSVWHWSYEKDLTDKSWPPLFRATAYLPHADRRFVGSWVRGQRMAQIAVCTQISSFLDEESTRVRGG